MLEDLLDELITPEIAERDYGVIVRSDPWRVDAEATRSIREDRKKGTGCFLPDSSE